MLVWLENNTDITRIAQKAENGPTNFQTLLMHGPVTNVKHLNPLLVDQVPHGGAQPDTKRRKWPQRDSGPCPGRTRGGGDGHWLATQRREADPSLSPSPSLSSLAL